MEKKLMKCLFYIKNHILFVIIIGMLCLGLLAKNPSSNSSLSGVCSVPLTL